MARNHLFRLAAPRNWFVKRKSTKWITRPMPGPHPLKNSVPLSVLLREILEYAKTKKEIKKILNEKNVLVDKVVRIEHKFPIGFMDVVEIPKLKEYYRVIYNKKGSLYLISITKDEANLKLLKIISKNIVKRGKMQLTMHDGKNILLDKFNGHVGDSILFDLIKKTISKILPLEKNSLVYLNGGLHIGNVCNVKDVIKAKDLQKPKVVVDMDGKEYITLAKYVFVIGKDKSDLSLEAKK